MTPHSTHPSFGSPTDSMYWLRQPAQRRSSPPPLMPTLYRRPRYAADLCTSSEWGGGSPTGEDFGLQALDEVVHLDAPLGPVVDAVVHADGAVLDIVVSDDQHVRHLLQLGPADAGAQRLVGPARLRPETLALEAVGDAHGVGVVVVAHRQHLDLHRRQPRREGAGVVLDEDGE